MALLTPLCKVNQLQLKKLNCFLTSKETNLIVQVNLFVYYIGVGVVPPWLGVSQLYHDSLLCWFFYFASCLSITAKLISLV